MKGAVLAFVVVGGGLVLLSSALAGCSGGSFQAEAEARKELRPKPMTEQQEQMLNRIKSKPPHPLPGR